MIQKQAMDPSVYVPVLAALAGGIFGYSFGDEEDDTATKLLRALGYGALAGVGTSLAGQSLFGRQPRALLMFKTDDEGTAKTLGTLGGAGLGLGIASLLPALYQLRNREAYEKAQRDLQQAEAEVDIKRQLFQALAKQKKISQQQLDAAGQEIVDRVRQAAEARTKFESTKMSPQAMSVARLILGLGGGLAGFFASG
jgi:hypothetical protein